MEVRLSDHLYVRETPYKLSKFTLPFYMSVLVDVKQ